MLTSVHHQKSGEMKSKPNYVDAANQNPGRNLSDRCYIRASGEVMAFANDLSALAPTVYHGPPGADAALTIAPKKHQIYEA